MSRIPSLVHRSGLALLGGIVLGSVWVNLSPASYYDMLEGHLARMGVPDWIATVPLNLTLLTIVSYLLMPLFVFVLGKEVFEALVLERDPRVRANSGLLLGAVLGGMLGAAAVWLLASALLQTDPDAPFGTGWPIPLGGDMLLAWLIGRWAFGPGHAALPLLALMAAVKDMAGLLVLGLATSPEGLRPVFLLLPLAATGLVWALSRRGNRPGASEVDRQAALALPHSLAAGALCWIGMVLSGLPPALALLPMIPVLPHATRSFGLFADAEELLHDPLNRIARALMPLLPAVLFLFGLTRGGIDLAAATPTTGIVLAALWIGKPLGVLAGALLAVAWGRGHLPPGLGLRDLCLIALILGAGFTVPVLAIDTSLPGGALAEAARLGLALSLMSGPVALGLARLWHRHPPKF